MSPKQLDEYLQVMRKNGVQSGAMEMPWAIVDERCAFGQYIAVAKLSFHFEPAIPDENPAPGGWKAPAPVVPSDLQTHGLDETQLPEIG